MNSDNKRLRADLERIWRERSEAKKPPGREKAEDITKYVYGAYKPTQWGYIFVAHHNYDLNHRHGNFLLKEIFEIEGADLSVFDISLSESKVDFKRTLFIDIETTGLAGGTGTCAFLIGVGYFYENKFLIDQYFMRNFQEEEGMLKLLSDFAKDFNYIISFNGKNYDIPLIDTRLILSRLRPTFSNKVQLDLLFPSRRIWRERLENCKLITLEQQILKFKRTELDVPGELIPGIYFDFIRTQNPDPLYRVFYHNEKDVLSLVGLTYILHRRFSEPLLSFREDVLDLFSLGRFFYRVKDMEKAEKCFNISLKAPLPEPKRIHSALSLAFIHKKKGDFSKAIPLWESAIRSPQFYLLPYVELAKYYEHKEKNFSIAMKYVNEALGRIQSYRITDIAELRHRRSRLERKLKRAKDGDFNYNESRW